VNEGYFWGVLRGDEDTKITFQKSQSKKKSKIEISRELVRKKNFPQGKFDLKRA